MGRGLLVVAGVAAGLAGAGCRPQAAEPGARAARTQPVEVAPIERRDMIDVLPLVGSMEANESASVRPEMTGIVRKIEFEEGQTVARGAPLLTIDDSALRAERAETEARHQLALANRDRARILIKSNSISRAELDTTEAEVIRLQAALDLFDVRLEKTVVRAPFDGVAGARQISPGDLVTPEVIITTVEDLARLKIDFSVPERFHRRVRVDDTFRLITSGHVDESGMPQALVGRIYFVSPVVDAATRAATVKGYLENPPTGVKPGMFATVEIVLDERKGILAVPEASILGTARGASVVAVREKEGGHVADLVPVRTGLRQDGFVEITPVAPDSLGEGTMVVAAGVGALVLLPGTSLAPLPRKPDIERTGSRI